MNSYSATDRTNNRMAKWQQMATEITAMATTLAAAQLFAIRGQQRKTKQNVNGKQMCM